jgi:hypothetical protein
MRANLNKMECACIIRLFYQPRPLRTAEMESSDCWHEESEGLNAQARGLKATIAANLAGILEL